MEEMYTIKGRLLDVSNEASNGGKPVLMRVNEI